MDKETLLKFCSELLLQIDGYDFFQAVRKIENALETERTLGTTSHPKFDLLRFKQNAELKFHTGAISKSELNVSQKKLEMFVNFFGLLGTNSPMPYFFTEHIIDMAREGNTSLIDFLDIFQHRMLSFFYRAWAVNQQCVSYENNKEDHFKEYIYSIISENYQHNRNESSLPEDSKIYYSGHLIHAEKKSESVRAILNSYFDVPVTINEFEPFWLDIPDESNFRLGGSSENGCLGRSTFAGEKTYNCTMKYKIIIGPMKYKKYKSMLPGTLGYRNLIDWLDHCTPHELTWEVQFTLESNEVPYFDSKAALGYSSWLLSSKSEVDQNDFIIIQEK